MRESPPTKAERTRALLITTTHELMHEHGIDKVTVEAVAESAGMVVGTVYNHFKSRSALLAAACRDHLEVATAAKIAALSAVPRRSMPERINLALGELAEEYREQILVLWQAASTSDDLAKYLYVSTGILCSVVDSKNRDYFEMLLLRYVWSAVNGGRVAKILEARREVVEAEVSKSNAERPPGTPRRRMPRISPDRSNPGEYVPVLTTYPTP